MDRLIIIGGGPAGMMASISSKIHYPDLDVLLIDGNQRLGTKLRLTGGGRCNVTANVDINTVIDNVPKNGKFLFSSLSQFGPRDIIRFFEDEGCVLKEEDHFRMFPVTDKSNDIVQCLETKMQKLGVKTILGTRLTSINFDEKQIILANNLSLPYDSLIIASGGRTLPGTGSDGYVHELFSEYHKVNELLPAEVPLVSNNQVIQNKTLQGLSFSDIEITIYDNKKIKHKIKHDLLITHFGLSGPAALRASYDILKLIKKQNPVKISIDFVPDMRFEELRIILEQESYQHPNLPKRLMNYLQCQSSNLQELLENIKKFPLDVHGTRGFAHAFLTNGGIETKEIDPKTMQSKQIRNISFAGEIIDYNAYTGGYNITCALSTGYVAGKHIVNSN